MELPDEFLLCEWVSHSVSSDGLPWLSWASRDRRWWLIYCRARMPPHDENSDMLPGQWRICDYEDRCKCTIASANPQEVVADATASHMTGEWTKLKHSDENP